MKLRYLILVVFLLIAALSLSVFFASQYVGLLPEQINSSVFLWVATVSSVVAFLSQFNDVISLAERFLNKQSGSKQPSKTLAPCDTPIIHGFGDVWYRNPDIRNILGCPPTREDIEKETLFTFQLFQGGEILEISTDSNGAQNVIYVLFRDDNSFQRFDGKLHTFDIEALEHIYQSKHPIDDKFAGVYWRMTSWHIKQRLGNPTFTATDSYGACQQFIGGRMFWIKATNDIYALIEYEDINGKHRQWKKFRNVAWWKFRK